MSGEKARDARDLFIRLQDHLEHLDDELRVVERGEDRDGRSLECVRLGADAIERIARDLRVLAARIGVKAAVARAAAAE